jgi:hypothetical protein
VGRLAALSLDLVRAAAAGQIQRDLGPGGRGGAAAARQLVARLTGRPVVLTLFLTLIIIGGPLLRGRAVLTAGQEESGLLLLLMMAGQHELGGLQLGQLGRIQPGIQRQKLGGEQERAAAVTAAATFHEELF